MVMTKSEAGKIGARRSASLRRAKALIDYYSELNLCKNCGRLIEVRTDEIPNHAKQRKFCNDACNYEYFQLGTMKRGPKSPQQPVSTKISGGLRYLNTSVKYSNGKCQSCGVLVEYKPKKNKPGFYTTRKYCEKCLSISRSEVTKRRNGKNTLPKPIKEFTKGELLDLKGYVRYKGLIIKHALKIYNASNRPKKCHICGYDHIQICHIKDVADFPDDATIAEINDPSNLVALCANHHREFDKEWFCLIGL
jgi:hypothetical protein